MSIKVQTLVWEYYPVGGAEKLTLLKLADHADDEGGRVYPSIATVAFYTGQSERTVQRQVQHIQKLGWLVLVRKSKGQPGDTNRYRIPIELIPQGVAIRVSTCHPSRLAKKLVSGKRKNPVDKPVDKSKGRRDKYAETGDRRG